MFIIEKNLQFLITLNNISATITVIEYEIKKYH